MLYLVTAHHLLVLQDVNKNGVILYTEFLAATLEMHGRVEEKRLAEVRKRPDWLVTVQYRTIPD